MHIFHKRLYTLAIALKLQTAYHGLLTDFWQSQQAGESGRGSSLLGASFTVVCHLIKLQAIKLILHQVSKRKTAHSSTSKQATYWMPAEFNKREAASAVAVSFVNTSILAVPA